MSASALRKDHPFSMRMPETDLGIIDRAASLKGRSRTEFIRDAAVRAAEDIIVEQSLVRMSPQGFEAFMAALDAPTTLVPQIAELADRRAPWTNDEAKSNS
jgi:uncharacterized protein (DUF1778 family)